MKNEVDRSGFWHVASDILFQILTFQTIPHKPSYERNYLTRVILASLLKPEKKGRKEIGRGMKRGNAWFAGSTILMVIGVTLVGRRNIARRGLRSDVGRDLAKWMSASLFAFDQRVNAARIGSRDREIRKQGKRVPRCFPSCRNRRALTHTHTHTHTLSLSLSFSLSLSLSLSVRTLRLADTCVAYTA